MPYTIPRGVERKVAGTEYYPEAIRHILKRGFTSKTAELRREPNNPYDPNALAVWIDGRQVGYISARMAEEYSPIIDRKFNGKRCLAYICALHQDPGGDWVLTLDMAWPSAFFRPDAPQALYAEEVRGSITPIIGDWMEASLNPDVGAGRNSAPTTKKKTNQPKQQKPARTDQPHKSTPPPRQASPMDPVNPHGLLAGDSGSSPAGPPQEKVPGRGTGWKVFAIICWVFALSIFVEPIGGTLWLIFGFLSWWRYRVKRRRWEAWTQQRRDDGGAHA